MDFENIIKELDVEGLDFQSLNTLKSQSQERIEEWLESRRGKFTASEFHRLMGYEDKPEFPKGAETYVLEKVIEILTVKDDENWTNEAMNWGKLNEKEAVEQFMEVTNLEVKYYGENQEFKQLGEHVGCTPDGLISTGAGIETKCPNSKTHFGYLRLNESNFKKECTDYYWQIQGSMYVTGRKQWYFVSYDPRYIDKPKQLKILTIHRNDEDIEKLKSRLQTAISRKIQLLKEYAES